MRLHIASTSTVEWLENRQLLSKTPFTESAPIAIGTSLGAAVVADFNGDKIPDVVVGPSRNAAIDVVLGTGKGALGRKIPLATGTSPYDLATADFNGDGRPDIVTSNSDGQSISIIMNKGKGKFAPAVNYPLAKEAINSNPFAVVTGDFNGDGKPDVAVTDPNNYGIDIFINKGDGTFKPAEFIRALNVNDYPVNPQTLRVADINGDKHPDLIFSETALNRVGFLIGNGKGGFTAETGPAVGYNPFDIAIADYNGDGIPDIAVADHGSNKITILPGKGKGKFGPAVSFTTDTGPTNVVAGDFNKDGKTDLAVSSSDNGTVRVYYGGGNDTFHSVQSFNIAGNATILGLGDVNGDGKLDILVGGTATTGGGDLTELLSK